MSSCVRVEEEKAATMCSATGSAPTGLAIITVSENDNVIIVVSGANALVDRAYIDSISQELDSFDMIVMQHEIPLDTFVR